ncbi:TetR/AcrR family transcriptional regulator [Sedimentibacter hydroxybenzoicus DSM 7310]|uniref:TetR/AcrR family transcriptional regulator n=1 Tax=Sedimentibacter hydroxybenzoicus DSM 7310 TaxID=1123245 RepID=A0A974BL20_SEDHY|nr:TetR/AcrR family transcriptional regulator [Sedimentibacter hydroxybenzoicus]NYB75314.1 TetR/AcrR family transcriptional regulator [Sedimentibacter hydroxybenzoicus DSM 7310]
MPKKTFHRLDEDKKEKILRSAIDEFHQKGFERATVDAIAANAGVAKGSIYQYFSDKKELLLYSATWALEYFMNEIDKREALCDMDVFEYFLSAQRGNRVDLLKREPLLVAFTSDVMFGKFGELTKNLSDEIWKTSESYMLSLIRNGKKKGTVRSDIDDETLLLFFQGVVDRMEMHMFKGIQDQNFEMSKEAYDESIKMLNNMVSLLKEGMGC